MDLGVSSPQLDQAARGFSFMADAPLDMRMDQTEPMSAADWVNQTDVHEMIRAFRSYGEERQAKRVALTIERQRRKAPILRTGELAELVSQALGGRRGKTHPATRVFQAIRMAVNRELEGLEQGLEAALHLLAPEGRLAVISFHSLEDRIAKQFFASHAGREVSLQQGGSEWQGLEPRVRRITKKPVIADEQELVENPRARSAKLRVVERI
jgi:16S rRNA (cytosine1402-N4)-methyltransferase